jgi:large subunit ribosomal protein L15e
MGYLKYVAKIWKNKENKELNRDRKIEWRASNSVVRVEKPLKITRARALGYKAKQGYFIVRVKLLRGGRQRPLIKKGRSSSKRGRTKIVSKKYQGIAEERANRKYPNCEVLGSYNIGKDGKNGFYEIILIDRVQGSRYDGNKFLAYSQGRVFRGLTSAARKARGLLGKGRGYEHARPSKRANNR